MMNWIYTWYRPDGHVTPAALADTFAEVFLHGVLGLGGGSRPAPARRGSR
jgi:hypothetical protein